MRNELDLAEAEIRLQAYATSAKAVEKLLREIENTAPKPSIIPWGQSVKFRYADKSVYAAMFLKLARLSSLLNSLLGFVATGRVQEQCILQRVVEETEEDISFLALAVCGDGLTERHQTFLDEFWKEDYADPTDPVGTRIPRAYSRRGIRSYISRAQNQNNPHISDNIGRTIYEMYSGFLHGSAPHIMDLFNPNTGFFHVDGMGMTEIHIDYLRDAQSSYYRGMLSAVMIIKAFGMKNSLPSMLEAIQEFEETIGVENVMKTPS